MAGNAGGETAYSLNPHPLLGGEPLALGRAGSSVTFDGDDSRLLARNWAGMVTACPVETRLATR